MGMTQQVDGNAASEIEIAGAVFIDQIDDDRRRTVAIREGVDDLAAGGQIGGGDRVPDLHLGKPSNDEEIAGDTLLDLGSPQAGESH